MANVLGTYSINSPERNAAFRIDLVDDLDPAHLDYIDIAWKAAFDKQYDAALLQYFSLPDNQQTPAAWFDIAQKLDIVDRHWEWRQKCAIAPGTNRKVYGLLNAGEVEATMLLQFGKEARLNQSKLPVVYVDYLAVAPWNRSNIQKPPRFKRLGTVLLGTAVHISRSQNCDGRCGLHSLPSAEEFYRRSGMQDLGIDPDYQNLRYFEFDATSARTFAP